MATIKIKFRPSKINRREGSIYYQIIHNRVSRQQSSGYLLYEKEWDKHLLQVIFPKYDEKRKRYLEEISNKIQKDIKRLQKIIFKMENNFIRYTSNDVIKEFTTYHPENYLFEFMKQEIDNIKAIGKIRTSETYAATLSSLKKFRNNQDLLLDDMDSNIIMSYEAYLKNNGVSHNSSSFYMRNLRAIYNKAVEKGITSQHYPFKRVYTGVDKTIKRALPLNAIKKIKELDFSLNPTYDFARDMFLFSFYTRGMSFVDMAYLQKKNLANGILSYCRRKTRQQIFIKWENCMQNILDKYDTSKSLYLLPIINPHSQIEERKQYIYAAHNINRCLKIIGNNLGFTIPLTLYVSRHSWASIAKSNNIPISIISEGMGHDSETTTRIYLASLDSAAIDNANNKILKLL